jgi:ribonuclease HI
MDIISKASGVSVKDVKKVLKETCNIIEDNEISQKLIELFKIDEIQKEYSIIEGVTDVFTDGSCINNKKGNPAGWAVLFPSIEYHNASGIVANGTNNVGELTAIAKAIEIANYNDIDNIRLFSDSEYAINSATKWIKGWKRNGWKKKCGGDVKNKEIMIAIDNAIMQKNIKIEFVHINSHTGGNDYVSVNNDKVDKMARSAL